VTNAVDTAFSWVTYFTSERDPVSGSNSSRCVPWRLELSQEPCSDIGNEAVVTFDIGVAYAGSELDRSSMLGR
jgi:hypothetical protein